MNKNAYRWKKGVLFFALFFVFANCLLQISNVRYIEDIRNGSFSDIHSEYHFQKNNFQDKQEIVTNVIVTVCYVTSWYQNISSNRLAKEGSRQSVAVCDLLFCCILSWILSGCLFVYLKIFNYFISKLNEIIVVIHESDGKKRILCYNI